MKEVIEKMAHLARFHFPEKELVRFTQKMKAVLHHIEQLNALDTEKIEPTSHATHIVSPFREDAPQSFEGASKILKNAPRSFEQFFEVPKVIDEN